MVPSFQELRKQAKRKEKLIKVACEKRKEEESGLGGDEGILLSQLVSGEISEEEVIDNVVLLVFAAHDTASFSVAVTFKMPAEHPDCHSLLLQGTLCFQNFSVYYYSWQNIVDIMSKRKPVEHLTLEDMKMKHTRQVARESLRLFPPIFGSFRKAIVDIECEGFTIPEGFRGQHTAPTTMKEDFKDPLTFSPSRFEKPIPPYALPFLWRRTKTLRRKPPGKIEYPHFHPLCCNSLQLVLTLP
ncbi:hypothetical protein D5086_011266 [Populus alba]|uniref:Uncharacterized protein n=1 Tax=Populus alba TaxID=43335 RepID=A0ACC4CCV1_POPAL